MGGVQKEGEEGKKLAGGSRLGVKRREGGRVVDEGGG